MRPNETFSHTSLINGIMGERVFVCEASHFLKFEADVDWQLAPIFFAILFLTSRDAKHATLLGTDDRRRELKAEGGRTKGP